MAENPLNFNDTVPAAPVGKANVKWQADAPNTNPAVARKVSAYIPDVVGDTGTGGVGGGAPAPAAGDAAAGKFLKADGTWANTTVTQAPLDNSTKIATTSYVDAAVAAHGSGGGGGASAGTTVNTTNDSFTSGQRRTYDLVMAKSFLSWRVTEATGKKFRLQLYETSAARAADASRPYAVPLQLGTSHGCLLDLYIEQNLAVTPFQLSPPVVGSNNDGPQTATIYAAVTSFETTTQNIQATISYVPLEV